MGPFGEKLRYQREQRGLTLEAISNVTKISTRMLRALEDEHFDQLPGGVFNKGFVRAYARQVGLNEEETVTEYLAALRESQIQSQQILPDFRSPGAKSRPATPADSRHHILPASEHPAGSAQGNGKELTNAERRQQERRGDVRRGHDRDPQTSGPKHNAPPTQAGNASVPLVAADVAHAAPETRKCSIFRSLSQIASRSHQDRELHVQPAHVDRDNDLRDNDLRDNDLSNNDLSSNDRQLDRSPSMPGFITFAPGAEAHDESDEADSIHSPAISRTKWAAVTLVIFVALAVWLFRRRHEPSIPEASASSAASSPAPRTLAPAVASSATSPSPISPKGKVASTPAKPSSEKTSAATPSPSSKPNTATPASIPTTPAPHVSPVTPAAAKIATPSSAVKPAPTFTLLIRADQTTWISIIADDKPETHETLIAPAHTSIRATHDVTVKVGNAAGVSFQLNGKEFPAQGGIGEVKTYFFDATGIKLVPQTAVQAPPRP